ncbi:hypothetical protein I553_9857 [Mycobacterium xenopi 4042]|uniref:Uncharacterized protein n=1 Tax=Mycobacterium xenopi 4042 TaxID=1299334 RepID=X7YR04_MYCXE|nr:hypothetical protein I553_9857 [Mycobacterium xenopi 4042]EUA35103.1 hypothetical protein I552_5892 [Mycobacterium xenopi 3993]
MRRSYAAALGAAAVAAGLTATAGAASADTNVVSASHQQVINYVIQRALSQRGVPYLYGGATPQGPPTAPACTPTPSGSTPQAWFSTPSPAPGSRCRGLRASNATSAARFCRRRPDRAT